MLSTFGAVFSLMDSVLSHLQLLHVLQVRVKFSIFAHEFVSFVTFFVRPQEPVASLHDQALITCSQLRCRFISIAPYSKNQNYTVIVSLGEHISNTQTHYFAIFLQLVNSKL